MEGVKDYIRLMRPKHYLKNILIFVPLLCSGQFFDSFYITISVVGFISFCLMASAVYCYNDLRDLEKDKVHPTKKNRPIASGKISKKNAIIFMVGLVILSLALNIIVVWRIEFV